MPSALITQYGSASLYVTRLLFSTKTLSTKFMVAPESTKASVCTFLPYTQSVTGILKEVVLLRAILLQDSSTTSDFCELIEGIHSSDCRSDVILYSPKGKSNLGVPFPFPLGGIGSGISSIDALFTLTTSGGDSESSLSSSNSFISRALND